MRPYADEEEKAEMNDCHEANIRYMRAFLTKIMHKKCGTALDVGCGDGRVTIDLLAESYDIVDCFDLDYDAVEITKSKTFNIPNVRHVDCKSMEAYQFKDQYDGIFLVWCVGYLNDEDLIAFL